MTILLDFKDHSKWFNENHPLYFREGLFISPKNDIDCVWVDGFKI